MKREDIVTLNDACYYLNETYNSYRDFDYRLTRLGIIIDGRTNYTLKMFTDPMQLVCYVEGYYAGGKHNGK